MTQLSNNDRAVLNCIFNPNLPLTEAYEEDLCADITGHGVGKDFVDLEEDTAETRSIKSLELEAIQKAEYGKFDDALNLLTQAIAKFPYRASLYNNRAQVLQLKGQFEEAFQDLTCAIDLAKENQKRTLCQALCQRGLLHRKTGRTELAKEDFENAANLGSHFAKSQLVELNPYAALCNQMLQKAIADLK